MTLLWKGWGCSLLVALIIATSFKSAIADWNVVPTGSMKPSILEGDRIFINKLAYDLKLPYTTTHIASWGDPQHGDIVVFYSPVDGTRMVKRAVGLPGDTIAMHNNRLLINGKAATYEPITALAAKAPPFQMEANQYGFIESLHDQQHPVAITPRQPSLRSFGPLTIPDNHYFMLGDNRDNSADSRYFGFVERSQIIGQATAVVVSLDINNNYRPRWQRFLSRLP